MYLPVIGAEHLYAHSENAINKKKAKNMAGWSPTNIEFDSFFWPVLIPCWRFEWDIWRAKDLNQSRKCAKSHWKKRSCRVAASLFAMMRSQRHKTKQAKFGWIGKGHEEK